MININIDTITAINGVPVASGTLAIAPLSVYTADSETGMHSDFQLSGDLWYSFTVGEGHGRTGETDIAPVASIKSIQQAKQPAPAKPAPAALAVTEDMINWLDNARSSATSIRDGGKSTTDFSFYAMKLADNFQLLDSADVFKAIDTQAAEGL